MTRASQSSDRALVVQLSDLHMLSGDPEEVAIRDALVLALRKECARREARPRLLAITGDVFNSCTLDPEVAVGAFRQLLHRVREALGGPVPTVIVPGNHDRRRGGLLGPFSKRLFEALASGMDEQVFVHGTRLPFLAEIVPHALHGLPLWVLAYDSTYLPSGLVSAGGILRQEDLLQAAARMGHRNPQWPVLMLLHHHLVPTPITDVGEVEADGKPRVLRWSVEHLLPRLVPNADREEMTMTALGAGTALTTLHAMRRPVIVMHGHKHYATARLLSGTTETQGDVMIVSAGTSGTAQAYVPNATRDAAHLWPSFNVLELDGDQVSSEMVAFGYRSENLGQVIVRPLSKARRQGARWEPVAVPEEGRDGDGPLLSENELVCQLVPSARRSRWDCVCERRYDGSPHHSPGAFMDTVDALEDGELCVLDSGGRCAGNPRSTPTDLRLTRARPVYFRIDAGICRTISEATRLFGARWSPYSWMGIMNRYHCERVRIEIICNVGPALRDAFASETDLINGMERPLPISPESDDHRIIVEYRDCPARTLIRVHWPLEAAH